MSSVPFETVYNAEMTCDGCTSSIESKLKALPGVDSVVCDLSNKTVSVTGTLPPSQILDKLSDRNPILRGTGESNAAAVAILENFESNEDLRVKGLCRFVGLPNGTTFVDLKMSDIPKGEYQAGVHQSGDVSKGVQSTGQEYRSLGLLKCQDNGDCTLYKSFQLNLYDLIGRSLVVQNSSTSFCGVIARSAGAWENAKKVCSCTGKTVWDEAKDAHDRGI